MGLPTEPVTLTVPQIAELNQKLSSMRHNVNNNLALLVAALELIRRKPDLALKMVDKIAKMRLLEEARPGRGGQGQARHMRAQPMQPEREPSALEAGMAGNQYPPARPD